MKNKLTSILFIIIGFNQLMGQDYKGCKIDLSPIIPSKIIDWHDLSSMSNLYTMERTLIPNKEFKVIPEHLPDYENVTENYTTVTWYKYDRELSKKELSKYNASLKKFRKQIIISHGGYFDNNPDKWPWRINDTTFIRANKVYIKKSNTISKSLPLFYTHDSVTELDPYSKTITPELSELIKLENEVLSRYDYESRSNISPIFESFGNIPVLDLTPYLDFIWKYEDDKTQKYSLTKADTNYIFYCKINPVETSKFLWRISQLNDLNILLSNIKSTSIAIYEKDIRTILKPQITSVKYDFKDYILRIDFTTDNSNQFILISGDIKHNSKDIFNLTEAPIYELLCFNQTLDEFNNLKLNSDYFNDPTLKKALLNSLESSQEWMNFKIKKVILTNRSQWTFVINRYTGLKESRFMFADVYYTSTIDNKCYYQKDVYFNQKADPIDGFIYSIFVSVPQSFQQFPCNLN